MIPPRLLVCLPVDGGKMNGVVVLARIGYHQLAVTLARPSADGEAVRLELQQAVVDLSARGLYQVRLALRCSGFMEWNRWR